MRHQPLKVITQQGMDFIVCCGAFLLMELLREPIDFKAIAAETGVRKGRIVESTHSGWVVIGHPDIDMICIDTPRQKGDTISGKQINNIKIVDNHWVYEN